MLSLSCDHQYFRGVDPSALGDESHSFSGTGTFTRELGELEPIFQCC